MKNIKIITYALGGLLAAAFLFFLFSFAYTSLETISAQNTQERLEKEEKTAKEWSGKHRRWAAIEEDYQAFKDDRLMGAEMFNSFKQQLQATAAKNRLGPLQVSYKIKSMFADVVRISVDAQFKGGYENIKRFIHEIENKKEVILFEKIFLNKEKTGPRVEARFVMEVYFVR